MPGMSKRYREDREVSGDRTKSVEPIGRLVFDLAKTLANSSACSKSSPAARVAVRSQSDAVSNLMPRLGAVADPAQFRDSSSVRFADMPKNAIDVAIGGKVDIGECTAHVRL
jgi:hypothetical protein